MRARRWDYSGNNLPAGTAAWPNVGSGSVRDLQFLYSNGERVIRQVTDETGANRYDLAVFDTLTLAGVQANAAGTGYRTPPSSAHVRHAGFAHVFLAPGLPLSDATSSRTFLDLKDSLGSSTITIDRATSEVVERTSYLPYGNVENRFRPERWAGAPESAATPRYTGKSIDAEVGVINFGARYLQAHLGRWMSPDPLVVANIIQDFNPYAFIEGRLAAAVDPDGLQATVVRPDYIVFDGDPLTGHVPRDAITLPTEKIAGTPPFEPAVSDPVAKARAMGRGHIEAGDLSSFMRGIGNVGLGVLNFLAKAGPADGPPLDPNPPSQLFTSIAPLQGHERAAWYGEEFGRALAFQVVSGMVGRAVTGAGTAENVAAIATPYGPAIQSGKAAALAARAEVEGGATVYRIGTMGKSFAADAQFWSLESPLSPGYAGRYGLPADNVGDFITGATMKPGTSFITRPAPAIGSNVGGGIEVVVPPGGVQLKWFTMPNF